MFLESFEILIENKKEYLGKTCLEMWSKIGDKIAMVVHKVTLKKSTKSENTKHLKTWKLTFFSKQFYRFIGFFLTNLRPYY